jgi:nucleotide-binding universal stress UspA family protein
MYDAILVPTDGSTGTARTLDHALSIAADNEATLYVLYVLDNRQYRAAAPETKEEVIGSLREEGERALEDAAVRARDAGVEVVTELRQGIPHKDIIEYADEADIDLIAMGTHGRTARDRIATLGSVTQRVVQNADRPVLVVNIGGE